MPIETLTERNFPGRVRRLCSRFPELDVIVEEFGIPDFWHRSPGFATLSLIILEQQVSLDSAKRAYERISAGLGEVTPVALEAAGIDGLRELGITRQKSRYLFELASAVEKGSLALDALTEWEDERVFAELIRLPGIGPWTANVYLMSALRRPDVWPPGDLALIKTIQRRLDKEADGLARTGERWAPERAVAARILWHDYLSRE